jgi:hypothetical protein
MVEGRERFLRREGVAKAGQEWRQPRRKTGSLNDGAVREMAVDSHVPMGAEDSGCHPGCPTAVGVEDWGSGRKGPSRM